MAMRRVVLGSTPCVVLGSTPCVVLGSTPPTSACGSWVHSLICGVYFVCGWGQWGAAAATAGSVLTNTAQAGRGRELWARARGWL